MEVIFLEEDDVVGVLQRFDILIGEGGVGGEEGGFEGVAGVDIGEGEFEGACGEVERAAGLESGGVGGDVAEGLGGESVSDGDFERSTGGVAARADVKVILAGGRDISLGGEGGGIEEVYGEVFENEGGCGALRREWWGWQRRAAGGGDGACGIGAAGSGRAVDGGVITGEFAEELAGVGDDLQPLPHGATAAGERRQRDHNTKSE